MFLSSVQPYVVAIIIAVVVLQYAFAIFCLLKLAYLDVPKSRYILWNLLILIVFFIGGAVFLVYYSKHPELKIQPLTAAEPEQTEQAAEAAEQPEAAESEQAEKTEKTEQTEQAEQNAEPEQNQDDKSDE